MIRMIRATALRAGFVLLAAAASPPPAPQTSAAQTGPADGTVAILGEPVVGPDGKTLGRLIDVMVDAAGAPQSAAIDFGGFIGIGSRKIVVPWSALRFAPQGGNRTITLEMSQEQIKAAPDYKPTANPLPASPPATATAPTPTPTSPSP
jgi:hypothetical protein